MLDVGRTILTVRNYEADKSHWSAQMRYNQMQNEAQLSPYMITILNRRRAILDMKNEQQAIEQLEKSIVQRVEKDLQKIFN